MTNMFDLDSFRKFSCYSNFKRRCLNVLVSMENIFRPVPINLINIAPSISNEKWPCFNITTDVHFIKMSSPVPCILSSVDGNLRVQ